MVSVLSRIFCTFTMTQLDLSSFKGSKIAAWSIRKTPAMWKVLTNHQSHHPTHWSPRKIRNHPTIVIKTLSSGWWHTHNISQPQIIPSNRRSPIQSHRPTLRVIIRRTMALTSTRTRINVSRQKLKTTITTINTRRTIRSLIKATTQAQDTTRASHHRSYRHWTISAASIRSHTSTTAHLETITFSMASSRWISTRTLMDRFRLRLRVQEQQQQRSKLKHRT